MPLLWPQLGTSEAHLCALSQMCGAFPGHFVEELSMGTGRGPAGRTGKPAARALHYCAEDYPSAWLGT